MYSSVQEINIRLPEYSLRKPEKVVMPLDDTDRKIISILEGDASLSFKEIARRLSMNESTVRKRILNLKNKEIIKFTVFADPEAVGYRTQAMLGLHVDPSKILDVGDRLANLKGIRMVFSTSGDYDFCVVIYASDRESLMKVVDRVALVEGVTKVSPSILVERLK